MGNIANYTDLSAELPTVRADVDVPLEDGWIRISWLWTRFVTGLGWARYDVPASGDGDDDDDET